MTFTAIDHARRLSIAPMMAWTDRHCRYFHRLLAPGALLYTEMVTTGALIHSDPTRHLQHDPGTGPVALQLGGSCPVDLARSVEIAAPFRYDEINLNVGCPSERVQNGAFGACLMAEPELVRDCCIAMRAVSALPITVKTRIGIDDSEDYVFFKRFIDIVARSGVATFVVHARKAWLKGLSPSENRDVPPLHYDQVYRLKRERPDLRIVINGGIVDPASAARHLEHCDGIMIGRCAYQNPSCLPEFERAVFGPNNPGDADMVFARMRPYIAREMAAGTPFRAIARHLLGLFKGQAGARRFRRVLSEGMGRPDAGPWLFDEALAGLEKAA